MQLNDIINEEIKKILQEGYVFRDEGNNFKFNQVIENPSFHNYELFTNDFDLDVIDSYISIKWNVGFWLNDFGIENFSVDIEGAEGQFTLEMRHKQSDEVMQEAVKDINETEWKFVIIDAAIAKGGSLYISDAAFDFKNNTCTISF